MRRIFVYGSLRYGMYNYQKYLAGHCKVIQRAYIKGTLYSLLRVEYPALVNEGDKMVLGEILELDETVDMKLLDVLERYYEEDNINNEYDRLIMPIYDIDQKTIIEHLPVYVYNLKKPEQRDRLDKEIEDGDYVRYRTASYKW